MSSLAIQIAPSSASPFHVDPIAAANEMADLLLSIDARRRRFDPNASPVPVSINHRAVLVETLISSASKADVRHYAAQLKSASLFASENEAQEALCRHPALTAQGGTPLHVMRVLMKDLQIASTTRRRRIVAANLKEPTKNLPALFLHLDFLGHTNTHRKLVMDFLPPALRRVQRERAMLFDPVVAWHRFTVPVSLLQKRWEYLRAIPRTAWEEAANARAIDIAQKARARCTTFTDGELRQSHVAVCRMVGAFLYHPSDGLPEHILGELADYHGEVDDSDEEEEMDD